MNDYGVKLQYIYHSGFIVEMNKHVFVFDYYQGPVDIQTFQGKQVYVFASHAHPDHFNPKIFDWQHERNDIQYILSQDITDLQKKVNHVRHMGPYEKIDKEDIKIETFGSTDEGVSFLVQSEGITIFHAGDLNWWYWWNDSPEGIAMAENMFKDEIAKIKGQHIDIAFFPVDPRLEHNSDLGAEYFIEEIKPAILVPMHFADDYEAPKKFALKMKESTTNVVTVTHQGQELRV